MRWTAFRFGGQWQICLGGKKLDCRKKVTFVLLEISASFVVFFAPSASFVVFSATSAFFNVYFETKQYRTYTILYHSCVGTLSTTPSTTNYQLFQVSFSPLPQQPILFISGVVLPPQQPIRGSRILGQRDFRTGETPRILSAKKNLKEKNN